MLCGQLLLKKLHILIAEDDDDDAELVRLSFTKNQQCGQIDLVSNGVELLDYLKLNRANPPHLILTDLNMPKKNGYEALQEIFDDVDFSKIPVFIYSTTINPSYAIKCKAFGARDFIIKPSNLDAFESMPDRILERLYSGVLQQ